MQLKETYVVGGAVRDVLLGRTPKDIDYVHVGSTPADMLALGMEQVGASFPVFLDHDGNEHALARTERKVGAGYKGFEVAYDPNVTLEDDLVRRDLTINAMAVPLEDWDTFVNTRAHTFIIDPHGGVGDLVWGILRHVSEAFAEDPVRVLRVARFAARYGFRVDDETQRLMTKLVDAGELDNLTAERVWQEVFNAVTTTTRPDMFFDVLQDVGATHRLWPDVGVPMFERIKSALHTSTRLSGSAVAVFGVVGMAASTESEAEVLVRWLEAMKAPVEVIRVVGAVAATCDAIVGEDFYSAFELTSALKSNTIFPDVADALKNTTWFGDTFSHNRDRLERATRVLIETRNIGFGSLTPEEQATLKGAAIGAAIEQLRRNYVNARSA